MKLFYSIFCIYLLSTQAAFSQNPQVLMLDSSYPPIRNEKFNWQHNECSVLSENNISLPEFDKCYDVDSWKKLGSEVERPIIEGMMDFLAKEDTASARKFKDLQTNDPKKAKEIRTNYSLMTHGTRSASVLHKYANGNVNIIPLRVVSSQVGLVKQNDLKNSVSMYEVYGNGCGLRKWTKKEIGKFTESETQEYHKKIQKIINNNKNLKVVSISLGYKKNWIAEDNPKCDSQSVELEYDILKKSWKNFITQNKNIIFVVAAGNENENFDEENYKNNDLWANLSEIPNLFLVGSLKSDGTKLDSSNFGKSVIMVLGERIEAFSPIPDEKNLKGYSTTLRGTSFSAPIIAGLVVKNLKQNPKLNVKELREKVIADAKKIQ